MSAAARANPHAHRGCGASRKRGGVYLECGLAAGGRPLEHFVCDPPMALPDLALSKRGVATFADRDGTVHLLDWIGQGSYPYPSDILEEVRQQGLSRLTYANIGETGIGKGCYLFLIHDKAIVTNPEAVNLYLYEDEAKRRCRVHALYGDDTHIREPVPCSRHHYADAPPTEADKSGERVVYTRQFTPSTRYRVNPYLPGAVPHYRPGIIARLPLTHISVVKGGDPATVSRLRATVNGVPVSETDA